MKRRFPKDAWITTLFCFFAIATAAFGSYEQLQSQIKPLPGSQQVFPEYQSIATPAVPSATYIIASSSSPHTTGLNLTTFAHQPDFPRVLTVTPAGTTADVTACTVTVNGTNIRGKTISDTFAISATQSSATTGVNAFKTVTSVVIPAACETSSSATSWKVGTAAALGLDRCLNYAGDFIQASLNGVKETTAPTIVANATLVENNTAALNSTLNGDLVQLMFIQNYRCLP